MKLRNVITIVALGLIGTIGSTETVLAREGWNVRIAGVWVALDGETRVDQGGGQTIETSADDTLGLGLSVEYGISDRVGVEVGYLGAAESEFGLVLQVPGGPVLRLSDDLGFSMIDASVNIRLTSGERTEIYVGPVIAQASFDDLRFEALGDVARIAVDDETGFGLVAGVDVDLGEGGWFFSGRLKYIDMEINGRDKDDPSDPGVDIDFDPLMVSVGFGVRF